MDLKTQIALIEQGLDVPVHLKAHHKPDKPEIIVIDDAPQTIIEINGIKYKRNDTENVNKSRSAFFKFTVLTMAMTGGIGTPSLGGSRKRPAVDLEKEFALIQNKKSKLSRNDRSWVEYTFNKNYTKI